MIGDLMDDKADVGRSKVVAFGPGIMEGTTRFFIKFPGQEINWLTFILPFSNNLWQRPSCSLLHCCCLPGSILETWTREGTEPKVLPSSQLHGCRLGLLDSPGLCARPKIHWIQAYLSGQLHLTPSYKKTCQKFCAEYLNIFVGRFFHL